MSNSDGWPVYAVAVDHLPERSMRLWLQDGTAAADLGTMEGVTGPPYVRDGDHVTVAGDLGHPVEGVVRGWLDGSVVVGALDGSLAGHGLVAPERVTFHADRSES